MRMLLITPYYPYPAEKTGGTHTINMIIKNLADYSVDIFYYGEGQGEDIKFSGNIHKIYYQDLRRKGNLIRFQSILVGKCYTSFMFSDKSNLLQHIISINNYNIIIYDQFASMKFVNFLEVKCKKILFMHDSMPMLFNRKIHLANTIGKIYYNIQAKYAVKEEEKFFDKFEKIIFVSSKDVKKEEELHPAKAHKFEVCNLGIDLAAVKNAPLLKLDNPSLIFTGIMDYEPNEDAMIYFVNNIFRSVRKKIPSIKLYIVGKNPTKKLLDCASRESNIIVTGQVDNIFSYIKSAKVYVSPLRIGSGKKNKIIEAMACGIPIIASEISMDGFDDLIETKFIKRASSNSEWVEKILELISNSEECEIIKNNMTKLINESYDWKNITKNLIS